MGPLHPDDLYSPREIALAAGVPEADVVAALGGVRRFVGHADAVRIGRQLARAPGAPGRQPRRSAGAVTPADSLFTIFSEASRSRRSAGVPLALSSTLHAGLIAVRRRSSRPSTSRPAPPRSGPTTDPPSRCGWSSSRRRARAAAAAAADCCRRRRRRRRFAKGAARISSPLPVRREPKPIEPVPAPPEPKPEPLEGGTAAGRRRADHHRAGRHAEPRRRAATRRRSETESHGPGKGGGAGTGTGTGLGEGDGSGIGPGSGGGTGGGPYRPGSGIEPPRLLREVKADYTEDARQRSISRRRRARDRRAPRRHRSATSRFLQGLAGGLNDRAVQAVRQWRFAPAQRQGAPVDVIVEVAVEFKLR